MYYYAIKSGPYEHYFIKVEGDLSDLGLSEELIEASATIDLKQRRVVVSEIYQLLDTKDGRFLVTLFDLKDKKTHLVSNVEEYYFSLEGVTDLMRVSELPKEFKKVSREIYENMKNSFDKQSLLEG